jgi:hypothetical protein
MKARLTVNVGQDADTPMEARKVCDFLFERCGGTVAEEGVLLFLRRLRHDHDKHPWTQAGSSDAIKKAAAAAGA